MKKLPLLLFSLFLSMVCAAQTGIQFYKGKTYIFDSYEQGRESDALGRFTTAETTIMLKGSIFTVERIPNDSLMVIKFLTWSKKTTETKKKHDRYNAKMLNLGSDAPPEEVQVFFVIDKATFNRSCSEYIFAQKWDVTIGTLTTPFKFRRQPFLFTPNLNLGASLCYQRKFKKNFTYGLIAGLSLSSVVLDSFSTKGAVTTNTDRPAVTPSFHAMIGYKNINLTLGIGWDMINKTSIIEQSWIYQGKRWIGVGLGVNLFNATNSAQTTEVQKGQQ